MTNFCGYENETSGTLKEGRFLPRGRNILQNAVQLQGTRKQSVNSALITVILFRRLFTD